MTMFLCQESVLSLCSVFLLFSVIADACDFPAYMQSNSSQRDWRTIIKAQYREFTQNVTVDGRSMRTVSTNSNHPSNDKICLQKLQDDRYVASYETQGQRDTLYICLQFVRRSDNIVQLRTSALSGTFATVCDQDLTLDPWIFVDKAHVSEDSQVCPLKGGYGLIMYDQEMYQEVCTGYNDNAWFESECIEGEGLYFRFRYGRCIPNVYMSKNQRTVCVASWDEGQYSFMVIRSDTHSYMWLMRYPQNRASGFMAYLMKELSAPMDTHPAGTNMYVRMTVVQNIARPVTSLCIDESEGCSHWDRPCNIGNDVALSCPRTCGACNVTRPSICSFQDVWQGDWIDASHGDRVAITFEPNTLTVFYNRLKEKFHCIHWDQAYLEPDKFTTYSMLVTEFDNGCRPKYSCVRLVHNEQSPVMFLQLSSEQNWPFTSAISDPVNCHSFEFDSEESNVIPNKYRSKHYKMLYSESLDHGGTLCNIPIQDIHNFTVTFHDDTQCLVGVETLGGGNSFSVSLNFCSKPNLLSSVPLSHHCIDSLRFFSSEKVVVTRTSREPYQMFCWFFPKQTRDEFYLVEAAHCNENTKRRIAKGRLVPFATFSRSPDSSTTVMPTPMPPSEQPDEGLSVTSVTPRNGTDPDPEVTNPATYASPVVVIAAIIFFVIFQIPCMCKNA